jgi:hypothetical protein
MRERGGESARKDVKLLLASLRYQSYRSSLIFLTLSLSPGQLVVLFTPLTIRDDGACHEGHGENRANNRDHGEERERRARVRGWGDCECLIRLRVNSPSLMHGWSSDSPKSLTPGVSNNSGAAPMPFTSGPGRRRGAVADGH